MAEVEMLSKIIRHAVNVSLNWLGLKVVGKESDDHKMGMELCLKGLVTRGFHPDVILDVGAATGQWTRSALKYWPRAQYFLIEPLEERNKELTKLHNEHENVSFILSAAGSRSCLLPIGILPNQLDGSSFLYGEVLRTVPVTTIDELLQSRQIKQPQFMKLDVQGYELEVLRGGQITMPYCPLILLELQFFRFAPGMQLIHESMAWMAEKGFYPYEIVDVLRRPHDGAMGQCDILFVNEGHWLVENNTWN
jgi:FkbM family methyltransferase